MDVLQESCIKLMHRSRIRVITPWLKRAGCGVHNMGFERARYHISHHVENPRVREGSASSGRSPFKLGLDTNLAITGVRAAARFQWQESFIEPLLALDMTLPKDHVTDEEAKYMTKALSLRSTKLKESKESPIADFIANKGEEQKSLLHGKPGVVKSTTIEFVASRQGKPFLFLTCGETRHCTTRYRRIIDGMAKDGEFVGGRPSAR